MTKHIGRGISVVGLLIASAGVLGLALLQPEHWEALGLRSKWAYPAMVAGVFVFAFGVRLQKEARPSDRTISNQPLMQGRTVWADKVGGVIVALACTVFCVAMLMRRTMTPEMWANSSVSQPMTIWMMVGATVFLIIGMRLLKSATRNVP